MVELIGHERGLQPRALRAEITTARSLTVIAALAIIGALYLAKPILLPLALAVLLTFVLAPAVRLLRGIGLGRIPSVGVVVVSTFILLFGIGSFLVEQFSQLADRLPQYQYVIQQKIESVTSATSSGILGQLSGFLEHLNQALTRKEAGNTQPQASGDKSNQASPIAVEIHNPATSPLQFLEQVLPPLLDPLATVGLVVVFVVLFLLQRHDLRDRFIRLAGSHDLTRTTEALNDAAHRLSSYFLAQTALNALFGAIVAVGLGIIGIPNPVLWGILSMLLRFVPYIGATISAAFPIALAVAVGPDWSLALWTAGLFIVIEPLIGQVLEPLVFGHSTGLSPVAVIIAATFWTWLWGPIGLLLSTPLTACLGVLGRHIEWLEFLDVLMGRDAPLSPPQSFYHRALVGEPDEATEQAEEMLKQYSLLDYYDKVVIQGLILAEIDARRGLLDDRHVRQINETIQELMEDLSHHEDKTPQLPERAKKNDSLESVVQPDLPMVESADLAPQWAGEQAITCVAGRGPFDHVIAGLLVQLLRKHGLKAVVEAESGTSLLSLSRLRDGRVAVVCLSSLDVGTSPAHVRNSLRRIRRQLPQVTLLAGLWAHEASGRFAQEFRASAAADYYAFSLREAVSRLIDIVCPGTLPKSSTVATDAA